MDFATAMSQDNAIDLPLASFIQLTDSLSKILPGE
jgi:hypothetical protein